MIEPVTISSKQVARGLNLPLEKIESVIRLLDEGYPVPFISRYRKEMTGNLDETQIRDIQERLAEQRILAERKQVILKAIESLGKLTPELDQKIREARTSKRLEDIYLPYKPKRETLASAAKAKGLEPLALEIFEGKLSQEQLDLRVRDFIDSDKGVATEADALLGAGHIIGEMFNERVELRQSIRDIIQKSSQLVSKRILPDPMEEPKQETVASQPSVVVAETATKTDSPSVTDPAIAAAPDSEPPVEETPLTESEPVQPAVEKTAETSEPSLTASSEETGVQTSLAATDPTAECATDAVPEAVPSEAVEETTAATETPAQEASAPTKPPVALKVDKKKKKKTPKEEKRLAELEKLYNDYFDFAVSFKKIQPYRVLAINRGEKAKVLRVRFDHDNTAIEKVMVEACVPKDHPLLVFMTEAAKDALKRLLLPALEREARRDLTENAEQQAIHVFAKNLHNLLLQPPLERKRVLAIDPGLRHGCKTVALDEFGNILDYKTVYIAGKGARKTSAMNALVEIIEKFNLSVIAIGNGTGCRETEDFVVKMIANHFAEKEIGYVVVNEAGASVYSTSPVAKDEFPNYDDLLRGAISIGRRLQDPLSELVKIEPGHLGVGMYQHDVKSRHLQESLEKVVESCVNHVGVDLNRASAAILRYVAGLNQLTAKRICEYKQQNGPFRSREQLKSVSGLGEATFTYAAGFLKISDGFQPLDATWIHPESYEVTRKILAKLGFSEDDLRFSEKRSQLKESLKSVDADQLATEFGVGPLSVRDIVDQLVRPGRDPRDELPPPVFKRGILHMDDLQVGAELTGTVLNVVDFGAFVDIGLHESGLIHISHIADHYVKDAHDVLSVGDNVRVWVLEVDKGRKRISLSMLPPGTERKREPKEPRRRSQRPPQSDRPQSDRNTDVKEKSDRTRPQNASSESRQRSDQGNRDRDNRNRDNRDRDNRDRDNRSKGGGRRTDRFARPKSFEMSAQKVIKPITDEMKKGTAPMRSFSDLAQFFGRVETPDQEQEKRKPKDNKKDRQDSPPVSEERNTTANPSSTAQGQESAPVEQQQPVVQEPTTPIDNNTAQNVPPAEGENTPE